MLAWTSLSAEVSVSVEDSVTAEIPLDSIEVSILTCTPGKDMYAKFGHTALRVRDYTVHRDVVFNYGCFDYNANNFVLKFLLGQTDYLLDAEEFEFLKYRYGMLGNGVSEQVLNLNKEEANKLLALLLENLRPENQEYRYNWLYDNCTERARDVIEKAVDGKIEYAGVVEEDVTVRDMLHKCLEQSPWVAFGIDLILGEEIDRKADKRIMMFLPDVFKTESDGAYIARSNGERAKYIAGRSVVLEDTNGPGLVGCDDAHLSGNCRIGGCIPVLFLYTPCSGQQLAGDSFQPSPTLLCRMAALLSQERDKEPALLCQSGSDSRLSYCHVLMPTVFQHRHVAGGT